MSGFRRWKQWKVLHNLGRKISLAFPTSRFGEHTPFPSFRPRRIHRRTDRRETDQSVKPVCSDLFESVAFIVYDANVGKKYCGSPCSLSWAGIAIGRVVAADVTIFSHEKSRTKIKTFAVAVIAVNRLLKTWRRQYRKPMWNVYLPFVAIESQHHSVLYIFCELIIYPININNYI